jgi:hypothetical protein
MAQDKAQFKLPEKSLEGDLIIEEPHHPNLKSNPDQQLLLAGNSSGKHKIITKKKI